MILLRGPLPWRPCPKRALEASPAQGIDGLRLTTHLPTRIDLTSWPLSPQLKSEAWWAGTIFSKHLELWLCQIQALIPALALTSSVTLGKVLFEYHSPPLCEKAMAPNSSTLAWKIPWMEVPDRLQSMGSQRAGHDWATSLSLSLSQCKDQLCYLKCFLWQWNVSGSPKRKTVRGAKQIQE